MTILAIILVTTLTATLLAIIAYEQAKAAKKKPVRVVAEVKNQKRVSRSK